LADALAARGAIVASRRSGRARLAELPGFAVAFTQIRSARAGMRVAPSTGRMAQRTLARATAVEVRRPSDDPYVRTARAAGLQYVSDRSPGLSRRRRGKSFAYYTRHGSRVRDPATLARIRKLAIPPAWSDVWICPDASGHIQATGRDARGRKQYRYHPAFCAERDRDKYQRMLELARVLPKLRAECDRALAQPELPREKVIAAVIRLLEHTLIRVGNEEYSRANHSYGLTTLRDRHVTVRGAEMRFRFRGKSGVTRDVTVRDRRLAAIVARCRAIRGPLLFQYLDASGRAQAVTSADVNAYLREVSGRDVTAKDFRTLHGTVLMALALQQLGAASSKRATRKQIVAALRDTSERLGNTPAVCRRSYVHPTLLLAYERGSVLPRMTLVAADADARRHAQERAVVAYLRRCVAAERETKTRSTPTASCPHDE
jgi:DNA topoisomerase-1